ncbi:hypothetical protein AB0T83_10850 [Fluviibacterium sp. DFM31]|uniref:Uncharacterized protein n=1 Tax=Meridianimarinicoccus marinus TaxID=3231483 RepID=A0ABV3LA64_9RHOB
MQRSLKARLLASVMALPSRADEVTLTMWQNHPEWHDRVTVILDASEAPDLVGLPAGPKPLPRPKRVMRWS